MLRKCPRCNEEINDDSCTHCPKCGNVLECINKPTYKSKYFLIFGVIFICFLFLMLVNFYLSNRTTSELKGENINCSDVLDEIYRNSENNVNFARNEELIIKGFDNGCQMYLHEDKDSFLSANAFNYALASEKKGNYTQAINYAKKSIDYAKHSKASGPKAYIPNYLLLIAKNYYKLGQYQNSKTYCLKALPLTKPPTNQTAELIDVPVLELLADNEYKLGEKQSALMHYEKAIKSYDIFINRAYRYSITGDISQEIKDKYYQLKQKYENYKNGHQQKVSNGNNYTTNVATNSYENDIRKKIQKNWAGTGSSCSYRVLCGISKFGELISCDVIENNGSLPSSSVINTIEDSSPFGPFPSNYDRYIDSMYFIVTFKDNNVYVQKKIK